MHPILAMGDIATPTLFLSLLISLGILLLAVGLFALSLRKRSLVAAVIAGFIGVALMPMARDAFIYPLTDEAYKSPDLIFWCRVVSVIWLLAFLATVFCFVRVITKWNGARHAT